MCSEGYSGCLMCVCLFVNSFLPSHASTAQNTGTYGYGFIRIHRDMEMIIYVHLSKVPVNGLRMEFMTEQLSLFIS